MLTPQEKKRNFDKILDKHTLAIMHHVVKLTNLKNKQYYDFSAVECKNALKEIRQTIDQVEYILEH